jgi:hypothetical protein
MDATEIRKTPAAANIEFRFFSRPAEQIIVSTRPSIG